jgi:hypothetical protein
VESFEHQPTFDKKQHKKTLSFLTHLTFRCQENAEEWTAKKASKY